MIAKVLVAEDNGHSLVTMLHLLKGRGYLTAFATDGDETVRLAREERPDLVVCKWRLSGTDGRHTVLQLRREKRLNRIPIIAVFDASLQVVGGRRTPTGCAGYVTEPIDPDLFVKVVDQHVLPALRPSRAPVPLRGRRRRSDRIAPM